FYIGSSKRATKAELDHEGSKRQKTNEASGSVQEQPKEEEKELLQEDLQQMMMVVPVEEVYIEALQVKYPIVEWEVYTEESRKYWKIIRVGNHTEAYQFFKDKLKIFDRDDLVMLWNLVKERFSSTEPADDKERTLWVELKRLFEPNTDDTLWKLQRYMHDPLKWRLYDTCGVHLVSTERGINIFMLVEKEYPLSKEVQTLMLVNKLVEVSTAGVELVLQCSELASWMRGWLEAQKRLRIGLEVGSVTRANIYPSGSTRGTTRLVDLSICEMLVLGCAGNPESRDTLTPNLIVNSSTIVSKIHRTRINGLRRQFQLLKKAMKGWKEYESIIVQDLETNLYWEFGKFTSWDGESLESFYSRFYKMMNELVRNQCHVTNHQVNVQFLLQLQPKWQRFVTLVKQSTRDEDFYYHKLYGTS
ncbi:hypothetical protein Tco_0481274, partial [Tanacetum coccineum]